MPLRQSDGDRFAPSDRDSSMGCRTVESPSIARGISIAHCPTITWFAQGGHALDACIATHQSSCDAGRTRCDFRSRRSGLDFAGVTSGIDLAEVLVEAERLECPLFLRYDPQLRQKRTSGF
jgi:hypothetical protein